MNHKSFNIRLPRTRSHKGFTLLEVMVALTIFSLIASVTLRGLAISMDSFERVKYKTFASMIAQNSLVELKLSGFPSITETKKDIKFADIEWKLVTNVSATEDTSLRRVDFQVFRNRENGDPFKELDYLGFVGKN